MPDCDLIYERFYAGAGFSVSRGERKEERVVRLSNLRQKRPPRAMSLVLPQTIFQSNSRESRGFPVCPVRTLGPMLVSRRGEHHACPTDHRNHRAGATASGLNQNAARSGALHEDPLNVVPQVELALPYPRGGKLRLRNGVYLIPENFSRSKPVRFSDKAIPLAGKSTALDGKPRNLNTFIFRSL